MQFIDDGPDIPLSLVRAHREGGVLFIVGAGISKSAGLPLFGGLIDEVYQHLGQALPGEPDSLATRAEEEARENGQYDRLAGLLEQRLVLRSVDWRQPRNVVRDAVAARLQPKRGRRLAAHRDILDLARGRDGRPRLVTTNFDTLFERVWLRDHGAQIASSAGPAMPTVGSFDFTGILHLHGRIEDRRLGLERTDLVLTSPNFGEAYMRNGWASRTVYDLLRRYTIVLLGYAADDPPMRYMLEATEDGRVNFPDLKPAYAFVADERGDSGSLRQAWAGKGLQPLIFPAPRGDFSNLYRTLAAWAEMSRDPIGWSRSALRDVAAVPFEASSEADREKFGYLTSEVSSVTVASQETADPAWLGALTNAVGGYELRTLLDWFDTRLEAPAAIEVALRLEGSARVELARAIELHLRFLPEPLSEPYARFWVLFVQANRAGTPDIVGRMRQGDAATLVRIHDVAARLEPRLRVDRHFRFDSQSTTHTPANIHDLGRFHFQAADRDWSRVLERWPADALAEERLLLALDRRLAEACEIGRDAGLVSDDGDVMSFDLAMVHAPEPGEGLVEATDRHGRAWRMNQPDALNDRFAPSIRLMTGLWRRLAQSDGDRAARIARTWIARDELIYKRLAAWAASISPLGPRAEVVDYLATTDRDRFWGSDLNVEFARFYCLQWNALPLFVRARIETAIVAGQRLSWIRQFAGRGNIMHAKALYTARELARIVTAGGVLSRSASRALVSLHERYDALPRQMPLLANLFNPSWSGQGYSGDARLLDDVPDTQLIATATALETTSRIEQADVWRIFVGSEPTRAFVALLAALARDEADAARWMPLLGLYGYRPDELPEGAPPLAEILSAISRLPVIAVTDLRYQLASIVERHAADTGAATFPTILSLWNQLLPAAGSVENELDEPLTKSVPGSALATLASVLMTMQSNLDRAEGAGFSPLLAELFDALVSLDGRSGQVAKAALMSEVAFLDWLAPDWVEEHLMSALVSEDDDAIDMMSVVASSVAPRYPRIFNRLKRAILRTLEHERTSEEAREYLSGSLVGAAFAVIGGEDTFELTAVECRRALTRVPPQVLSRMAWELVTDLRQQKGGAARAERWRQAIEPFMMRFWPNDVSARTDEVSQNLARLPALSGDAFEEAVTVILDLVRPIARLEIGFGLELCEDDRLVELYPRAVLQLISSIIDRDSAPPDDLEETMSRLLAADPTIAGDAAFWRLRSMQRPR